VPELRYFSWSSPFSKHLLDGIARYDVDHQETSVSTNHPPAASAEIVAGYSGPLTAIRR
jgi:hypothetical protein